MKRREGPQIEGALSAGGGGGGWMKPRSLSSSGKLIKSGAGDPMYDRAANMIEQSIKDRGGYPTSKGVPRMTRAQQRSEQMRADYEATQEQGVAERDARRQARKEKFGIQYKKGGMCREYGK